MLCVAGSGRGGGLLVFFGIRGGGLDGMYDMSSSPTNILSSRDMRFDDTSFSL